MRRKMKCAGTRSKINSEGAARRDVITMLNELERDKSCTEYKCA